MKRILLLIDAMSSGGAERQMASLAVGLKKRGQEVRLVQFYPNENFYASDLDKIGIQTEVYHKGQNGLRRAWIISRLVRSWQPDMVICYKNGTCMASCLARMFIKFNLVVSERNTTQQLTRGERLRFFLYRWADHIVPNSYSQAAFIENNFPHLSAKVKVITNMVDAERFSPGPKGQANAVPQIITAARVAPQKNVITFLKAVAEIKNRGVKAHFHWFGDTTRYATYWEDVTKNIERLNVSDYITFHGATQDIVAEYRKSDIFVLPSLYEGFPNVICEAMSSGLPIVCSNICDNPYIVEDNVNGYLFDPDNPQDMACKLLKMISLPLKTRQKIGIKNRNRIINLCSPDIFISNYIKLI